MRAYQIKREVYPNIKLFIYLFKYLSKYLFSSFNFPLALMHDGVWMFLVVLFDLSSTYKLNLGDLNGKLVSTHPTQVSTESRSLNSRTQQQKTAKRTKKRFSCKPAKR